MVMSLSCILFSTVLSLYNTPRDTMDLAITLSSFGSEMFCHGILQINYNKVTMELSFPYDSFVKLSFIT